MDMRDLHWLSIAELSDLLRTRQVSALEVTEHTLTRIAHTEPEFHAYASVITDGAIRAAKRADRDFAAGIVRSSLQGVPIGVKDLVHTAGHATSAGSRVVEGFVPDSDAAVVSKLRSAAAVIIGKTTTHEFAYGVNSPPTCNAWNRGCYPGGSSAGSGVAVAVGSCYGAIGTDSGGSIRVPAAVNAVVGLKPTFGRISSRGIFPMSSTLDTVGTLTRTVRDAALMLGTLAGATSDDHSSWPDRSVIDEPVDDYLGSMGGELAGIRLGVDRHYFFGAEVSGPVAAAVDRAIDELRGRGAKIVPVRIPHLELSVPAGLAVLFGDASEWHQRLLRQRGHLYEPETRVMVELGELVLATSYVKAQKTRTAIQRSYRGAFITHQLTALVAPGMTHTALPLDNGIDLASRDSAAAGWLHLNFLANVIGVPSLCLPVGMDASDKPIAMQLLGRPFGESSLLRIGHAYEQSTSWHKMHPGQSDGHAGKTAHIS